MGTALKIKGVPFIQQDGMVMVCAQASMWIAAKYMHYAYALPRYLPYEITERATKPFIQSGRPIPSTGLAIEQIMSGDERHGLFPAAVLTIRRP